MNSDTCDDCGGLVIRTPDTRELVCSNCGHVKEAFNYTEEFGDFGQVFIEPRYSGIAEFERIFESLCEQSSNEIKLLKPRVLSEIAKIVESKDVTMGIAREKVIIVVILKISAEPEKIDSMVARVALTDLKQWAKKRNIRLSREQAGKILSRLYNLKLPTAARYSIPPRIERRIIRKYSVLPSQS
jgi:hypothetical protein